MKTARVFLLACLLCLGHAFGAEPISFQKLPAGDTIEVTFQSSGCFHQTAYEFEFLRGKETTVSIKDVVPPTQRGKSPEKITVSHRDLAGLDRLLKFYRSNQPGGCTTIDNITLVQKRNGKVVAEEKYTDATCATHNKKDLTLFSDLVKKAGTPNL